MGSIRREIVVEAAPEGVWDAVRDAAGSSGSPTCCRTRPRPSSPAWSTRGWRSWSRRSRRL